jgi:hypothetical protein
MKFMNGWEIETYFDRYGHLNTIRGKAARFLAAFRNEVDMHSDGWAYWSLPVKAAKRLMELVEDEPLCGHMGGPPTEADFKRALSPIKAFYTRRGYAAGMEFPKED